MTAVRSEVEEQPEALEREVLAVGVSQSGRTEEVVETLTRALDAGVHVRPGGHRPARAPRTMALVVPGRLLVEALARAGGIDPGAPRGQREVTQTDPGARRHQDDRTTDRTTTAPPHDPVPTAAGPPGGLMDAQQIVAGLGGADDILETEPCTTRLRAEVRGPSLVVRRGDLLR